MSRVYFISLVGCGMAGILATTVIAADPVKVMPLGDSITRGWTSSDGSGYRLPLYTRLTKEAGWSLDFVGSQSDGPTSFLERQHEGHNGFQINDIYNNVNTWIPAAAPQKILLMIGTNDVWQKTDLANASNRLNTLIGRIYSNSPSAEVYVGSIAPIVDSSVYTGANQQVNSFNAAIPGVVSQWKTQNKSIQFVDAHAAVTLADLPDGVHPSNAGYAKMADAWYKVLTTDPSFVQKATLVQSNAGKSGAFYEAANGSLILNNAATLAGKSFTGFTQSQADQLSNGDGGSHLGNTGVLVAGDSLTYTLRTDTNKSGYDISKIDVLGGYSSSLAGYANTDVTISYRLVGSSTFQKLGDFTYDAGNVAASSLSVTDSTGTVLSGIDAISFRFAGSFVGSQSYLQEIDVVGTPTSVPEPTMVSFIALGTLSLLSQRRRKHASAM